MDFANRGDSKKWGAQQFSRTGDEKTAMKSTENFPLVQWSRNVIGKRLLSVGGSLHACEGSVDYEKPLAIQLTFEEGKAGTISGAEDGCSIQVTGKPLPAYNMAEFGDVVLKDLGSGKFWKDVTGAILASVNLLMSGDIFFGFDLIFDNSSKVVIGNIGDELKVFTELPAAIWKEEGAKVFPVLL